ncbi:hypothetical protein QCA50_010458 [Cerrena zonata]|uniref:Translation machinery-associated protein 16 n=1 Tax=Cerrena zonata TaxID=2478898 RepID=A0AAW0G8E0_9APHY
MAPAKANKGTKGTKKEKVFHPLSRKADQLMRSRLRKGKLENLAKSRNQKHHKQVDLYSFFFHAIPPEGTLTLEDIHSIVSDIWLQRLDSELESERSARRKGRPKSTKETKLEEQKLREAEEYRTGLEVIDLTHPINVNLFRQWDQKEVAYIHQLRFIRITSETPDVVQVSRPGNNPLLMQKESSQTQQPEAMDMDDSDEAPLLLEPASRFSSTITAMDQIP